MISIFKEKKIKNTLNNIIENKTFDHEQNELFVLDKDASELDKNIYLFTASSLEKRQTIVLRLEITNAASNVWVYFVEGYNRYYLEQIEYTQNCPLKISKEEDAWNVSFAGYLKKNNNKDLARITFNAKFISDNSLIDTTKYLDIKKISKLLCKEKENEQFYNYLQNKPYNEYHQFGIMRGKIIVEGQHHQLDIPAYRKHTFGKLDWNIINNHFTIMACNKKNNYLFEMISLPFASLIETGIKKQENEEIVSSSEIKYERQLILKGAAPENLNILFNFNDEKEIGIHAKKIDNIKYVLQDGEYNFTLGVAEFLIDGVNYRGIFELGYNNDKIRWFNNKEISKIV